MKNTLILYLLITFISILKLDAQFMAPNIVSNDGDLFTSTFIAEWAGDTASIETYTIVGNHLFGKAIHLFPEPHLQQFEFLFEKDGSIREMDVQFYSLDNTSVPLNSKTGFLPYRQKMNSDNGIVDFRSIDKNGEKQWVHTVLRMDFNGGWIPIMGQWQWLTTLLLNNKLDQNLKFINAVIGDYELELNQPSKDEVIFKSEISPPITFYVNVNGKIDSINALGSPWNFKVFSTSPVDVEKFTNQFANKKVMGNPSPQGNVQLNIGQTELSVSYGRPSKRGRKIFGELVPFGKVWRTGAGATTKFTTTSSLNFNGVVIPKGTYNLFTIPENSKWTLIFNTEKEAWGSAYRSEFDFAKVQMKTARLKEPVEMFTIEIKQTKDGGELIMMWDKTKSTIEFTINK